MRWTDVQPGEILRDRLRNEGLWSVKRGDDHGLSGADTVLLDGRPVSASLLIVPQVDGHEIETVEGMGSIYDLHPIQEAYLETGAIQCGFCTPGMVLTTKALLEETDRPSEEEARVALDGNLCRCTGYVKPLDAIQRSAQKMRGEA